MDNHKTFYETFDADKLKYIIDNYEIFADQIEEDHLVLVDEGEYIKDPLKNFKTYLKKSYQGISRVEYRQNEGCGRYFAVQGLSQQNFVRCVRHTIAREHYQDLDMVNAHPVILLGLCKRNNFPCKNLEKYVSNREEILESIGIDRAEAKKVILSIINGGTKDYKSLLYDEEKPFPKFLRNFKQECKTLHDKFAEEFPKKYEKHVHKKKSQGKKNNLKASFMNTFLCHEENLILTHIWKEVGKPKNCVLCFDGIQLPIDMELDLRAIEKTILRKFKIPMKLEVKPMNDHLLIPDQVPPHIEKYSLMQYGDYENLIARNPNKQTSAYHIDIWIQRSLAWLKTVGKWMYINLAEDDEGICKGLVQEIMYTKSVSGSGLDVKVNISNPCFDKQFYKSNKHYAKSNKVWNDTRMQPVIYTDLGSYVEELKQTGKVPMFDKVVFKPYAPHSELNVGNNYNLFRGFPLADLPSVDIDFTKSKWYHHIFETFCSNDEGEFNHFLDHIADIIQDPSNVKPNAHLFYSQQGTGKGLLGTFMQELLGFANVVSIQKVDRYFKNQFNTHTSLKLLKIFEELQSRGAGYTYKDQLKAEITMTHEDIERKNEDVIRVQHFARYWLYTNNENALMVEPSDRRFTLHRVNNKYADNQQYFSKIVEELRNPDFIKAAFDYFATRKYDPRSANTYYENSYKKEVKIDSLPSGLKFLKEYLEDKYMGREMPSVGSPKCKISSTELADIFINEYHGNRNTLLTQLKNLGLVTKTLRKGNQRFRGFDLHPQHVESLFQKYLKNDNFQFDFGEEDSESEMYLDSSDDSWDDVSVSKMLGRP